MPTPPTHQLGTKMPTPQTQGNHHVSLTHQSVKYVAQGRMPNPRGHPFTDDIIADLFLISGGA